MALLFQLISQLCMLVMLAVLADLLLPSGDMRRVVRLVCGLLLLHIMMTQVFAWLQGPVEGLLSGAEQAWLTQAEPALAAGQQAAGQAAMRRGEDIVRDVCAQAGVEVAGVAFQLWEGQPVGARVRVTGGMPDGLIDTLTAALGASPGAIIVEELEVDAP